MQVSALGIESKRLEEIHKDQADTISSKQNEIEDNWERLKEKGSERKSRLDDSYNLHRFLADFRDLVSWIHDMKAIISADDLAKDVAGAEALLDRHQEHKVINHYYNWQTLFWVYNKTFPKQPLSKTPKIGFQNQISLNAGQKYCRMLQREHSAILSTLIKLPFVIKIFVVFIFEWPL